MIQDYPGRLGYWDVGVPPSGPMDAAGLSAGQPDAGNPDDAAGLEMAINGPTLKFNLATRIVLTGAAMKTELNGQPVAFWQVVAVAAGMC